MQAAAPFQPGKPVAIITEGLLTYLTREEKDILSGNVHKILNQYGGIWVTPDVSTRWPPDVSTEQTWKVNPQTEKNMRQQIRNISGLTERDIEKNSFTDADDVRQFFTKAGFAMEEHANSNVLEDLSSVNFLGLSIKEISKMLQTLTTLILTPT